MERTRVIRSIALSDADDWAAMRARLWPDADRSELAAETHAFLAGSVVPGLTAVFIAADADAGPVGFLELCVRDFSDGCDSTPVPHVEGWYVEEHARLTGVGRELLDAAEAWSRAQGFRELASDAEERNHASIEAHTRCGFEEVERLVKFRKSLR